MAATASKTTTDAAGLAISDCERVNIHEANPRSSSRRAGGSGSARGTGAPRAGRRARVGTSRHHGLRPDPPATVVHPAAALALAGVVLGGLALARPAGRFGTASGRLGVIVALLAGLIAVVNGVVNLAIATGGPGSGNVVVGGAAAVVLGSIAMALGGLALAPVARPRMTS